ncbi:MAG: ankyrin repeat domain-containing protein, partial [Bdellovibrionaceae bacterium]|nr:ankyrin repeat domain-containing protein [Pseudobdellovibrionaceae bacterium]
ELGFEDFLQLQSLLEVEHPTGLTKNQNIEDIISSVSELLESVNEIESKLNKDSYFKTLRIRPLSILEAPYRSCMGDDCASQLYFEEAFDPNFHYFTLTDRNNKSFGQITIVLGTSKKEGKEIKTAFLDKIQNVPLDLIKPMLKGIQFSLKEKDYILGIPKDTTGLSNRFSITEHVKSKFISNSTQILEDFFPHSHQYEFKKGYTRAYNKLSLVEISEVATNINYKITAGDLNEPKWAPKELSAKKIFEKILPLQNSTDEKDQITFITELSSLYEIKDLNIDLTFIKKYLINKMKDQNLSFKLRKFAFFYSIEFFYNQYFLSDKNFLENLLKHFSQKEEQIILGELSNWKKSSNQLKKEFIYNFTIDFFLDHKTKNINPKLKNIIDVNSRRGDFDSTILMDLIKRRNITAVNKILKEDVDVNALDNHGQRALQIAVLNEIDEIVEALIPYVENINAKDRHGYTALHLAIKKRNKKIADTLIRHGANVNLKNIYGDGTLHMAILTGDNDIVEALIPYVENINAKDRYGKTPLDIAIEKGYDEIIKTIRYYITNINSGNKFVNTPIDQEKIVTIRNILKNHKVNNNISPIRLKKNYGMK